MVSRQETARALLTPGEVMQLPPSEAIVMVAGAPPIRARKIRYFADGALARRVRKRPAQPHRFADAANPWTALSRTAAKPGGSRAAGGSADEGGLKQEQELAGHEHTAPVVEAPDIDADFDLDGDELQQGRELQRRFTGVARQAAMDRDDGIPLGDDS